MEDRHLLSGIHDDGTAVQSLVAEGEGGVPRDPVTGYYLPPILAATGFPKKFGPGQDVPRLGNALPTGLPAKLPNAFQLVEVEPNDSRNTAQAVPVTTNVGGDTQANITGTFDTLTDEDFFKLTLKKGDIISVVAQGAATDLSLMNSVGTELQGHDLDSMTNAGDPSALFPPDSPMLRGGNANLGYVIPNDGTYYIYASAAGNTGGAGGTTYNVLIELFRPVLESEPIGGQQILYLDFDGEIIPRSVFDPTIPGTARLSPLDFFLPNWGLDSRHRDLIIDRVVGEVQKQFEYVATAGTNGNYVLTGNAGEYSLEIRNSRDHGDPWGLPNVSRVIIGGTQDELQIGTIGIAQSIDVGNFDTTESAVVLLDVLSLPTGGVSIAQLPRHATLSLVDVIGDVVGRIAAHEAGHFFAAWHQDATNLNHTVMDSGGSLLRLMGVGVDGIYGTDDDVFVGFESDTYALPPILGGGELFTGVEDLTNAVAHGLSTGKVGGTISGLKFNDVNGNGRRDGGENGLAGFTIFADLNSNSTLDAGEPRSVTAADGTYTLRLPAGTAVKIAEVQQTGFRQTFPAAPGTHSVTVSANQTLTGINFGNQAITAQAVGVKWRDDNGNGQRDAGEPGLEGVWIYVDADRDRQIDAGEIATRTDAFGRYSLALPGPGTYHIREVLDPGYVQTFPGGAGEHVITVTGTEVVGRDFGNQVAFDYGDAPTDYPVLKAENGARHGILEGFFLGTSVDGENDGIESNNAQGDDAAGVDDGTGTGAIVDDEDGVTISGPLFAGLTNQISVRVNTGAFPPGMLQAWIDFNRDGDWNDPGEQIVTNKTLRTGSHLIDVPVPANAIFGATYARFRYSHSAGLSPTGSAPTGEVEDYQLLVLENAPNANDDQREVLQDSVAQSMHPLDNDFASATGVLLITTAGTNGRSTQGGVVSLAPSGRDVFYSPRPGFFGVDTFTYTVTDGANKFDTATVTVTVLPNFENPVAVDDSFDVAEGSAANPLDVLVNDIVGRHGPITIVSHSSTLRGGVVSIVNGGQSLEYSPPISFPGSVAGGTDQFTYTIADSNSPTGLSTAKVTIHVKPSDNNDNLVNFLLDATDLNGTPLPDGAAIAVGDRFKVVVRADDLRTGLQALGVESAYMDLLFDARRVSIVGIEYGTLYPNARANNQSVPGVVDEVGAFAGDPDPVDPTHPTGAAIVYTLTVQAVSAGPALFKADPADTLPLHETVLRRNQRVGFEQIGYDSLLINILGDIAGGPRAIDDSRTTQAGVQNLPINVLANDSQGTGSRKDLLGIGTASNGTVTINNNGTPGNQTDDFVEYVPNSGFVGSDQFTYTMGNGTGLTSTAQVTVHVLGAQTNRDVEFILTALDPTTKQPITQVEAGDRFILKVEVKDNRTFPPRELGVFSAFMDLLYDANLATVIPSATNARGFSVQFGAEFPNSQAGALVTQGFVDEIGAVGSDSATAHVQTPVELALIEMVAGAGAAGQQIVVRTDPADIVLHHDVLLYDGDVPPLTPSQILFGELKLNVVTGQTASAFTNPGNAFDVNADGFVSPIDVLHVINDLNRTGARSLQIGGGGGAQGESPATLFIDVNGDGQLSPIDALKIINYLNSHGAGEGEFVASAAPVTGLSASSREWIAAPTNSMSASIVDNDRPISVATADSNGAGHVSIVESVVARSTALDHSTGLDLSDDPTSVSFDKLSIDPARSTSSGLSSVRLERTGFRTSDRLAGDRRANDAEFDVSVESSSTAELTRRVVKRSAALMLGDEEAWDGLLSDDLAADISTAWQNDEPKDVAFGDL